MSIPENTRVGEEVGNSQFIDNPKYVDYDMGVMDDPDVPRFLTDKEISYIYSRLPDVESPIDHIRIAETSVRNVKISEQMKDIKLKPSKFQKYADMILNKSYISIEQPGNPSGNLASESIAEPMTQALLSSYHKIGISESVQGDLNAIKEVFNLSKERKREIVDLHFNDKDMTALEARETLIGMEGITLNELLKSAEIITGTYNDSTLPSILSWYSLWKNTVEDCGLVFDTGLMFRLTFNPVHLYTYGITLNMIIDKLSNIRNIKLIPSPSFIGIIDLFIEPHSVMRVVDESIGIHTISVNDALIKYFDNGIKPSMNKLMNSYGISGMNESRPIETNIIMKLDGRERIRSDGSWDIYGDHIEVMMRSIPKFKYVNLFRLGGYEIVNSVYTRMKVHFNVRSIDPANQSISPLSVFKSQVSDAADRYNNHMNASYESANYVFDFNDDIWRAANYVSARAHSRQIIDIMSHPAIDENLTVIRNEYIMYLYFGIEAAVNVMIREIDDIIKSNSKEISLRHTITIVNAMTRDGHIIPTTSKGTSKQGRESFSKAAFEKALAAITSAAISGQPETTHSIATSILFGKQIEVGTGVSSVRVARDQVINKFKGNVGLLPEFNLPDFEGLNIEGEVLDARGLDEPSPEMSMYDFGFDGQDFQGSLSRSCGDRSVQSILGGDFRQGSSVGNESVVPPSAVGRGKKVSFAKDCKDGTDDTKIAKIMDDDMLDDLFAQMES